MELPIKTALSTAARALVLAALSLGHTPVFALDASDFSDLVGYSVAAVTSVVDEFEGCDFDRRIKFDNGEAGEAVDMQVEWDEPVEEMENRAKPRVSARANASELLGRVARLEKAVTRVFSVLRRRAE